MVGEYRGKRFEVGTVKMEENIEDKVFDVHAEIPHNDKNGGEEIWLNTFSSYSTAVQFVQNLNKGI